MSVSASVVRLFGVQAATACQPPDAKRLKGNDENAYRTNSAFPDWHRCTEPGHSTAQHAVVLPEYNAQAQSTQSQPQAWQPSYSLNSLAEAAETVLAEEALAVLKGRFDMYSEPQKAKSLTALTQREPGDQSLTWGTLLADDVAAVDNQTEQNERLAATAAPEKVPALAQAEHTAFAMREVQRTTATSPEELALSVVSTSHPAEQTSQGYNTKESPLPSESPALYKDCEMECGDHFLDRVGASKRVTAALQEDAQGHMHHPESLEVNSSLKGKPIGLAQLQRLQKVVASVSELRQLQPQELTDVLTSVGNLETIQLINVRRYLYGV